MSSVFETLSAPPANTLQPNDPSISAVLHQATFEDQSLAQAISKGRYTTIEQAAADIGGDTQAIAGRMRSAAQLAHIYGVDPSVVWNNFDQYQSDYSTKTQPKKTDETAIAQAWTYGNLMFERNQLYNEYAMLYDPNVISDQVGLTIAKSPQNNRVVEIRKRLDEINRQLPQLYDDENRSWWVNSVKSLASAGPSLEGAITTTLQGATVGMIATMATGGTGGGYAAGTLAQSARSGFELLKLGAQAGLAYSNVEQMRGQVYGDLVEKGADHSAARIGADMAGMLAIPLSMAQLNLATAVKSPIANIVKSSLQNAADKTLQEFATKRIASTLLSVGSEFAGRVAGQELVAAAQSLANDLSFNFGVNLSNTLSKTDVSPIEAGDIVSRAVDAMQQNLVLSVLTELPVAGVQMRNQLKANIDEVKNVSSQKEKLSEVKTVINESPATDIGVLTNWVNDIRNDSEKYTTFLQRQGDAETRTKFFDDSIGAPEQFFIGASESGAVTVYRSASEAAASLEKRSIVSAQDVVSAIEKKYGLASGEWIRSVMRGNELMTDVAKDQLSSAPIEQLRNVAKDALSGVISEQSSDVAKLLGLQNDTKKVVAVYVDSSLDESIVDSGDALTISNRDAIIPVGSVDSKSVRLPKRNGKIVTIDQNGKFQAVDPDTGESVASIEYQNDNGVMRITSVPDSPSQALELLNELPSRYILDIPQSSIDKIKMADKTYRGIVAKLGDIESKSKAIIDSLKDIPESDAGILSAKAESDAQVLAIERDALISQMQSREQELLHATIIHSKAEVAAATQDILNQELSARGIIEQKVLTAAPQFTKDQVKAFSSLVTARAHAMGMTLSQWSDTFLDDIVFADKGTARGSTVFSDSKALLNLTKSSDFSTLIHEFGHIVRRQLPIEDQLKLAQIYGVRSWDLPVNLRRSAEEKFARDFETYFIQGNAPTKELANLFEKIMHWMREIYTTIATYLNPEVKSIIDKAFEKKGYAIDELYQNEQADPFGTKEIRQSLFDINQRIGSGDQSLIPERDRLLRMLRDSIEKQKEDVRMAVESGATVPVEVLQDYNNEPWAMAELQKFASKDTSLFNDDDMPTSMPDMEDASRMIFDDSEPSGNKVTNEKISRSDANRLFISSINDAMLTEIEQAFQSQTELPVHLVRLGDVVSEFVFSKTKDVPTANGKTPRQMATEWLINHPNEGREAIAYIRNDVAAIEVNTEINLKDPIIEPKPRQRLSTSERFEKIRELLGNSVYSESFEKIDNLSGKLANEISALEQDLLSFKEGLQSAKKESRMLRNEVVSAIRDKQKAIQEIARVKAYKESLLSHIFKKPVKSVDYKYARQILDLQDIIREKKDATKDHNKRVYEYNKNRIKIMEESRGMIDLPRHEYKPYLDQYSIDELELVKREIDALSDAGKSEKLSRDTQVSNQVESIINDIISNIRSRSDITRGPSSGNEKENHAKKFFIETKGPQYNMDYIDGGKDFKGPVVKYFYNGMSDAIGKSMDMARKRLESAQNEMVRINHEVNGKNVSAWHAQDKYLINDKPVILEKGHALTYEEAMGIYMGMQNESSAEAIRYGNLVPESVINHINENLDQTWKTFGDWLIDHGYGDRYEAIAETVGNADNIMLGKVSRYSPMARRDSSGSVMQQELSLEAARQAGVKRTPADGFKNARIAISKQHQTPIRLDALTLFTRTVEKQEVYIAARLYSKSLNRVIADSRFRNAIKNSVGNESLKDLEEWLARTLNPDIFGIRDGSDQLIRKIRANGSIAYLGFSLLTIAKQLPGFTLFLQDGGFRTLKTAAQAFSVVGYKKMTDRMKSMSPEMNNRVVDKILNEVSGGSFSRGKAEVIKWGFKGLQMVDALTVTIGWNAVFEKQKALGLSDADAAREATNSVNRTQPVGHAKDMSKLMSRQDFTSLVTQFGSAMNQIWSMVTHLPPAKRGKAFFRYMLQIAGILSGGLAMSAIGSIGKNDSEKDTFGDIVSSQLIASIPILGMPIDNAIKGYDAKMPLFSPFTELVKKTSKAIDKNNLTEKQANAIIDSTAEVGSLIIGLPYLQIKRAIQAATQSSDPGEFVKQLIWGAQ